MTSQSDDTKQNNKDAALAAELAPLRMQIDAIDSQLLTLLSDRAKVAQEVGEVKKRYSSPAFRPDRELQVIRKMQSSNPGPLHDESIAAIWREVMSACRGLEQALRIGYLGPAGTFSEQAVIAHFGHEIQPMPCPSIDEVFRAAESLSLIHI